MTTAEFPQALKFLFKESRYKVAYGGRGGAKSWGFARALLILGAKKKLRILCTREVQNSIKDSVHKLLSDQIQRLELGAFYTVLETQIRGLNGTEFAFAGLATNTVESIKSFEGCDIVWAEEAQFIKKRSWDILIPTIRKEGSEIWISFNPDLESDDTYHRFVTNAPPSAILAPISFRDNPWFTSVMEEERIHCKNTDPDNYMNIWEGECKAAVEGAIYHKEIALMEKQGRICNVPYDPMLKVHLVWDLGWNDSMVIGLVQKNLSEVRIIESIEDSHRTLGDYSAELKEKRYNWGRVWLPHDGYAKDFKTGRSTAALLRKLGWDVPKKDGIRQLSIEEGIKNARMVFPRFYFNKGMTERLIESCKRYRRKINKQTDAPSAPLHDEFSHGADMLRYVAANIDQMANEDVRSKPTAESYQPFDCTVGY